MLRNHGGAAAKAGSAYEIANGAEIHNLGEKAMAILTPEGNVCGEVAQIAPVSKPLKSVRSFVKNDHTVVFDNEGSFVINKQRSSLSYN